MINEGNMQGDALVQVYVECSSPFAPLHPRLCGFRRITLQPGERKTVTVPLDPLTDTVITDSGEYVKAKSYSLYVGLCQPDEQSAGMCGSKPIVIKKQTSV